MFTSGTAVEVCVSSLTEHERGRVAELWEQLPVFVVGKATAQAGKCFMSCEPIENLPILCFNIGGCVQCKSLCRASHDFSPFNIVGALGLSPTGSHSGNAETLSRLIIERKCP